MGKVVAKGDYYEVMMMLSKVHHDMALYKSDRDELELNAAIHSLSTIETAEEFRDADIIFESFRKLMVLMRYKDEACKWNDTMRRLWQFNTEMDCLRYILASLRMKINLKLYTQAFDQFQLLNSWPVEIVEIVKMYL